MPEEAFVIQLPLIYFYSYKKPQEDSLAPQLDFGGILTLVIGSLSKGSRHLFTCLQEQCHRTAGIPGKDNSFTTTTKDLATIGMFCFGCYDYRAMFKMASGDDLKKNLHITPRM